MNTFDAKKRGAALLLSAMSMVACGGESIDQGPTGTVEQAFTDLPNLHHIALNAHPNNFSDPQLFETIRFGNNAIWNAYRVLPKPTNVLITKVQERGVGFDTHIMVTNQTSDQTVGKNVLFHGIRSQSGSFTGFNNATDAMGAPDVQWRDMALCEVGTSAGVPGNQNDLHVVLAGGDGILRHTIRFTDT